MTFMPSFEGMDEITWSSGDSWTERITLDVDNSPNPLR
jgi:hypothetical protein